MIRYDAALRWRHTREPLLRYAAMPVLLMLRRCHDFHTLAATLTDMRQAYAVDTPPLPVDAWYAQHVLICRREAVARASSVAATICAAAIWRYACCSPTLYAR